MQVIKVNELTRTYKTKTGILKNKSKTVEALKGVTFNVDKGEIFGLLGPNGAGKTTLIKILTTLLAPTSGEARVLGYNTFGDEKKIRPRINFIFGGERNLYWRLSARDNLIYFADLYKLDKKTKEARIEYLLDLVGLTSRADEKVETYSKGMKQKLQIARGLINDPEILLMDEPTIGLDPVAAIELRNIVRKLSKEGKTILLTTHYMYEAEELCDRIALIKDGSIIALNTSEELKKIINQSSTIEVKILDFSKEDERLLNNIEGIENIAISSTNSISLIKINCLEPIIIMKKILELFSNRKIINVSIREASLEDAYINLMGEAYV